MIIFLTKNNAAVYFISTLYFFTTRAMTPASSMQTADGKTKKLNSAIRIKGVDIVGKNIIVWSGKKAEVRSM